MCKWDELLAREDSQSVLVFLRDSLKWQQFQEQFGLKFLDNCIQRMSCEGMS